MTPDDPKLTAYALGELSPSEAAAVEKEIQNSKELQDAVGQIRSANEALVFEFAVEPIRALTNDQRREIFTGDAIEPEIGEGADVEGTSGVRFAPIDDAPVGNQSRGQKIVAFARSYRVALATAALVVVGFCVGAVLYPDEAPVVANGAEGEPKKIVPVSVGAESQLEVHEGVPDAFEVEPLDSRTVTNNLKEALGVSELVDRSEGSVAAATETPEDGKEVEGPSLFIGVVPAEVKGSETVEEPKIVIVDPRSYVQSHGINDGPEPPEGHKAKPVVDEPTIDNPFFPAVDYPISTLPSFVDTASYLNLRRYLTQKETLPPRDAVFIEEMVNYFDYDYSDSKDGVFSIHVETAECPWNEKHHLVRVGVKGRSERLSERRPTHLTFLVDVSESMRKPGRLDRIQSVAEELIATLRDQDFVSIVVHGDVDGLVLPPTPGRKTQVIRDAFKQLENGGATEQGTGLDLAFAMAMRTTSKRVTNRVVWVTDGNLIEDAEADRIAKRVENRAKRDGIETMVLGLGAGRLNESLLSKMSGRGMGEYFYLDTESEARRVFRERVAASNVPLAKELALEARFNPSLVDHYRLIGFANRPVNPETAEGADRHAVSVRHGHELTALYEVELVPEKLREAKETKKEYAKSSDSGNTGYSQAFGSPSFGSRSDQVLLAVDLRYRLPKDVDFRQYILNVNDRSKSWSQSSPDFQFAAAVSAFGMLLRDSEYKGDISYADIVELAERALGDNDVNDKHGYRREFIELVKRSKDLVVAKSKSE